MLLEVISFDIYLSGTLVPPMTLTFTFVTLHRFLIRFEWACGSFGWSFSVFPRILLSWRSLPSLSLFLFFLCCSRLHCSLKFTHLFFKLIQFWPFWYYITLHPELSFGFYPFSFCIFNCSQEYFICCWFLVIEVSHRISSLLVYCME